MQHLLCLPLCTPLYIYISYDAQYYTFRISESFAEFFYSDFFRLMRTKILTSAVIFEVNDTVAEAKQMFDRWINKNEPVAPDLREVVYSAGVKYGGLTEWQHCWSMYNTTEVPTERKLLLKALGIASDPWLLQRYKFNTFFRKL